MRATTQPPSVLIPVFDGDITAAALDTARALVADTDARLVFLHLRAPPAHAAHALAGPPDAATAARWQRLAAVVAPGRVFVDALSGDPARIIPAQADRFGSDWIVLGCPERAARHHAAIDRIIRQVRRAVPGRVLVAGEPDVPVRATPVEKEIPLARPVQPDEPPDRRTYHADRFPVPARAARPDTPRSRERLAAV
jgi:hypothetical protein